MRSVLRNSWPAAAVSCRSLLESGSARSTRQVRLRMLPACPRPNTAADPADRQSQSIDKALVVALVLEDPLARIAPAHDMMDGARVLDSQRPAHSARLMPCR